MKENFGVIWTETIEIEELEAIIEKSFITFKNEFDSGFVAESKIKIMAICQHYRAVAGLGAYPEKKCNAPWVSAVIESNGDVLPCFFHKPYGNINSNKLENIINSNDAISFRRHLKIDSDSTCQRCVCSLHVPLLGQVT